MSTTRRVTRVARGNTPDLFILPDISVAEMKKLSLEEQIKLVNAISDRVEVAKVDEAKANPTMESKFSTVATLSKPLMVDIKSSIVIKVADGKLEDTEIAT